MNELARVLDEKWQRNYDAAARRIELKERAIAFLGGCCTICGYDKCPSAFDFHHIDPAEKDFEVSSRSSWEAIEHELKKCVLLCSNCHREVHAGWHPQYLTLDDGGKDYGDRYDLDWEDDTEVSVSTPLP